MFGQHLKSFTRWVLVLVALGWHKMVDNTVNSVWFHAQLETMQIQFFCQVSYEVQASNQHQRHGVWSFHIKSSAIEIHHLRPRCSLTYICIFIWAENDMYIKFYKIATIHFLEVFPLLSRFCMNRESLSARPSLFCPSAASYTWRGPSCWCPEPTSPTLCHTTTPTGESISSSLKPLLHWVT